jgi:hypothetical protein
MQTRAGDLIASGLKAAHLIFACMPLYAQLEPGGGVTRRDLNLGSFAAPLGQQAWALSQSLLVVILKQILPSGLLVCTML